MHLNAGLTAWTMSIVVSSTGKEGGLGQRLVASLRLMACVVSSRGMIASTAGMRASTMAATPASRKGKGVKRVGARMKALKLLQMAVGSFRDVTKYQHKNRTHLLCGCSCEPFVDQ